MQSYTKEYLTQFGYHETDFVPCECCEKKATEIHHLLGRKGDLLNDIKNLMAICRKCHEDYGQVKEFMCYLLKIHIRRLQLANIPFNNDWFEFYINKYSIYESDLQE